MASESRADLFIRLLIEALEADIAMRKLGSSMRSKDYASRFKGLCRLDLSMAKGELHSDHLQWTMHYSPSDDITDRFDQSH